MLQGINFDYLNSFKKLFEIYLDLNNSLETDIINKNRNNKIEEYKLDLIKQENNESMNIKGDTNIKVHNRPINVMKLLLEVYGFPRKFLEENNQLIIDKGEVNRNNILINKISTDIFMNILNFFH